MMGSIREELRRLVTQEALLPDGELARWRTGSDRDRVPAAVLAPSTEEEVAQVLSRASQEGWKVLPAGLGSWLTGGGPTDVTLVLSTRRLNQVQVYEPADLTITAGAGLSLTTLRDTTANQRQWLPLDPPGALEGSLGAVVTLGVGGSIQHFYGTPRDHVLGLTLISGDGRTLRWGGRVVKNVAGFDLTRLTVGSWGALGVVTSVSTRLFPIPEMDLTLLFPGPDVKELLPAAREMALSTLPLAGVELVDPLPSGPWGGKGSEAVLILRLLGGRAEVAEMEARAQGELAGASGGPRRLEGDDSRRFNGRMNSWEKGRALVARLALPPASLGSLIDEGKELSRLASGFGLRAETHLASHVGAGILRVAVSELPVEESSLVAWVASLQGLRSRLEAAGGGLTLSSGPDFLLRKAGPWGSDAATAQLMAGLKTQFDPAGILAPGRLGLK
ncbi:MAG: FAD-binding oxidoreductase [Gemmatimonadota bacterium]|jgi:glycolate oxidase FAD binding subunit